MARKLQNRRPGASPAGAISLTDGDIACFGLSVPFFSLRSLRRMLQLAALGGLVTIGSAALAAEGLGGFVGHLEAMQPRVRQGVSDPRAASEAINELDADEGTFAHYTTVPNASRAALLEAYGLLERMLGLMYDTYHRQHDQCLIAIGNGNMNCDYNLLEQLELRALYP